MQAELRLAYPPTENMLYRSVVIGGSARVLLSKQGRAYKQAVRDYLLESRMPHFGRARLQVDVIVHVPDARRRDLLNLHKVLMDSLQDELEPAKAARAARRVRQVARHGIWCDDEQIDDVRFSRGQPVKGGAVVVFVQTLGAAPQQATLLETA